MMPSIGTRRSSLLYFVSSLQVFLYVSFYLYTCIVSDSYICCSTQQLIFPCAYAPFLSVVDLQTHFMVSTTGVALSFALGAFEHRTSQLMGDHPLALHQPHLLHPPLIPLVLHGCSCRMPPSSHIGITQIFRHNAEYNEGSRTTQDSS